MDVTWVLWALLSAFSLATSDALIKRAMRGRDEYVMAGARLFFATPLLVISLFLIKIPEIKPGFYVAVCGALPLELIALILYVKALKVSPMGLTLPFLSLSPVFLTVVSYFMLGEKTSYCGFLGIALITLGSYVLNINEIGDSGMLGPVLAIRREKGSLYMIAAAFIYSFTAAFGKMGVENSSPVFFGAVFFILLFIATALVALLMNYKKPGRLMEPSQLKAAVLPGFFYSVMVVSHMVSVKMTKVAYMISVKRLSLLIGVIYGYLFFKETGFRERVAGTLLMLAGVTVIAIFN